MAVVMDNQLYYAVTPHREDMVKVVQEDVKGDRMEGLANLLYQGKVKGVCFISTVCSQFKRTSGATGQVSGFHLMVQRWLLQHLQHWQTSLTVVQWGAAITTCLRCVATLTFQFSNQSIQVT